MPSAALERAKFLVWLAAIVAASWLSDAAWLAAGLGLVLLAAGRAAFRLTRRALLAALAFTGTVSLTYAAWFWWQQDALPLDWLVTVNLRVLLMALLTFLFIERTNLFLALGFSRRLSFLLVLAVSQSLALRRTLDEFRQGLDSRALVRVGLRDRYRAAARAAGWLFDRALANAHESARAMQSRGMFR